MSSDTRANDLARLITNEFKPLPGVIAVAWGGSQANNLTDHFSDLDIYIYTRQAIPVDLRTNISKKFTDTAEINNQYFETGDEFYDRENGLGVDLIYRDPDWIESELARVLTHHQASLGYSTAVWHNVRSCRNLYDPEGWFARLKEIASQPYPEELRRAIIAKNYPLLRQMQSSYYHQIEKSLARQDKISYNHRVAAFLASYFDIIFAFNHQPHPGEKRLIPLAKKLCPQLPANFETDLNAWLDLPPRPENVPAIFEVFTRVLDDLDKLLLEN